MKPLFNTDNEEKSQAERRHKRTYLEILSKINDFMLVEITRYSAKNTRDFFIDVARLDYAILSPDWDKNHTYIVEELANYDILRKINITVDQMISSFINDKDELDRFINGITNSLTLSDKELTSLRKNMRKYPALIFMRLVEMMGTE